MLIVLASPYPSLGARIAKHEHPKMPSLLASLLSRYDNGSVGGVLHLETRAGKGKNLCVNVYQLFSTKIWRAAIFCSVPFPGVPHRTAPHPRSFFFSKD